MGSIAWVDLTTVEAEEIRDLEQRFQKCLKLGGEAISDRRQEDGNGFCIIRDPAGAVAALYQQATE
jgi:hypothetical protein